MAIQLHEDISLRILYIALVQGILDEGCFDWVTNQVTFHIDFSIICPRQLSEVGAFQDPVQCHQLSHVDLHHRRLFQLSCSWSAYQSYQKQ